MKLDLSPSRRRRWLVTGGAVLLGLGLLLGLCLAFMPREQRFVDGDQGSVGRDRALILERGGTAGQTFVSRHAGLAGIEFWLTSCNAAECTLTLHLRSEPAASEDLAVTATTIPPGSPAGYVRFAFPPRSDSLGHYYYAWLEAQETGASLPLEEGSSYLDGAAYQDGEPLDAQTTFRLAYAPAPLILDLVKAVPRALGLVCAVLLLVVMPGRAILAWLGPKPQPGWAEQAGLSAGIGLALLPLLVLWTSVAGLRLGAAYAWLLAGIGLCFALWKARGWRPRQSAEAVRHWARSSAAWPDAALVIVLALIVGSRLLAVRTLEVPLWGDSYQHTMIVQLLVDHGGLFDSWQPYSPIDRFTYHFGFHSTCAAVHWLTGLPVTQSVLWTGQLLNALAALALYPLAVRISGSRWGGVVCVLAAGLLSRMPSEYVNWGRYTQLAGQVILPVAAWLTWELLEKPGKDWRLPALVALVVAGLALTHVRVLGFYAAGVAAMVPFSLRRVNWKQMPLRLGLAGLGAALLFLPWLMNSFQGAAASLLGHQLTTLPDQVKAVTWETNAAGDLRRYLAPGLWLTLPLGLVVAVLLRRRGPLAVVLWSFLMALAANPSWLSLPGTGVLTNFTVLIAAYIPAGLMAGFLASTALTLLPSRRAVQAVCALAVLAAGCWGAVDRLRDVDTYKHAYVTRPDVRATAWIRETMPPDARFLVNSGPAFGATSVVGTDGGWWLPLLAGRENSVPPLSYANELRPGSELRQQIEKIARLADEAVITSPEVVDTLRRAGVTHVYVGQRQGLVNDPSPTTIEPRQLLASSSYEPVYHQDRVWIFALKGAD